MIGKVRRFLAYGGAIIAIFCISNPGAAVQGAGGILSQTDRPELHEDRSSRPDAPKTVPTPSDKAFCAAIRTVEDLDERMALGAQLSEFAKRRAKPIEALLQGTDLERYRALIEQLECEAAQNLMLGPYLIAHPEHTCLFGHIRGESAWAAYVASDRYPELNLCGLERDFQDAVARMQREGIKGSPYVHGEFGAVMTDPFPLSWRNRTLFSMYLACFFGRHYQPACVSYVRIALTTDHIEIPDMDVYFILERARLIGDNPEIARLRAMVEPRLSPDMRERLKDWTREVIAREASMEPN